jgi:hypothetical protein
MAFVVLLSIIILAVALPRMKRAKARKEELAKSTRLEAEAEAFLASARVNKRLEPIAVLAMLKKGEEAYYQEDAALYEPRAVRHHDADRTTVHIKGVTLRTSSKQSRSTQELKKLDQGRLIVTNKRFIFVGETEHRSLDLAKIDGATVLTDGLRLSMSNRSKPVSFSVANPWLLAVLLGVAKNPDYLTSTSEM